MRKLHLTGNPRSEAGRALYTVYSKGILEGSQEVVTFEQVLWSSLVTGCHGPGMACGYPTLRQTRSSLWVRQSPQTLCHIAYLILPISLPLEPPNTDSQAPSNSSCLRLGQPGGT